MVTSKSTASPNPSVYRVNSVPSEQGTTYRVLRCEPVANFSNEEHATFLLDLLQKRQADHG
jgi:hypothetical protein